MQLGNALLDNYSWLIYMHINSALGLFMYNICSAGYEFYLLTRFLFWFVPCVGLSFTEPITLPVSELSLTTILQKILDYLAEVSLLNMATYYMLQMHRMMNGGKVMQLLYTAVLHILLIAFVVVYWWSLSYKLR